MKKYDPIPLEDIKAAQKRIKDDALRTPLVKLNAGDTPAEIYLKLENLQPMRAFKVRPASNAVRLLNKNQLKKGVWTISSGNFAQGLAWMAQKLGIPCTICLSETVPEIKAKKSKQLGAKVLRVSPEDAMDIFFTGEYDGVEGTFVHPSNDPAAMAGNGTLGLEILEDMPDVDAIVVPWGIGGFACGVASAVKALNPRVKVITAEIDSDNKYEAALKVGGVTDPYKQKIFPEMYDLADGLIDEALVVTEAEVYYAVKLLAERNCVISELQGAYSVAAALSGKAGSGKVACVITGGNIDLDLYAKILTEKPPM